VYPDTKIHQLSKTHTMSLENSSLFTSIRRIIIAGLSCGFLVTCCILSLSFAGFALINNANSASNSTVTALGSEVTVSAVVTNSISIPSDNPSEASTRPLPSETPIPYNEQLAALEGVDDVRVVNVTPFQGSIIVLLEIDVERGFNSFELAGEVRQITMDVYGDPEMEFSVILWDKVTPATNYTWDKETQFWRTTNLASPP